MFKFGSKFVVMEKNILLVTTFSSVNLGLGFGAGPEPNSGFRCLQPWYQVLSYTTMLVLGLTLDGFLNNV